jgi:hypothetical protein
VLTEFSFISPWLVFGFPLSMLCSIFSLRDIDVEVTGITRLANI